VIFGLTVGFHTTILILRFVHDYNNCKCKLYVKLEILFIIADAYSIILSILLTVTGVTYTQKQQEKLEGIYNPVHYKNPLLNIWIWISINILANLVKLAQSLFYTFTP
jgi:hypothetical protein